MPLTDPIFRFYARGEEKFRKSRVRAAGGRTTSERAKSAVLHLRTIRDTHGPQPARCVRTSSRDKPATPGLVSIDAPERRVRCLRTVHPDNRANEMSLGGGVSQTSE
jgi:hypothetical protein